MVIQYNFRSLAIILKQTSNVPETYTVQHFRWQVVKNMSVTCKSILTILSPLLQETDKSFKEIMKEIGECNLGVNIHIALTCIRLFLCIPIVLLKPSWKKPPGKPKQYNKIEWHAVSSDKQKSAGDKLFCV